MQLSDYSIWAKRATEWSQKYLAELRQQPVRSACKPGDIFDQIDASPPEGSVSMEQVFADFEDIIPPGMTHWQHPRFFAYFPANASTASMIAEQLMTTMGAQCMLWQTSPAATELETRMMDWLRQALGLPEKYQGVIHLGGAVMRKVSRQTHESAFIPLIKCTHLSISRCGLPE